ncbi:MAG: hypothetical protein HOO96_39665 [Polyangiaceae bacterium]|nr:hypothetical protein [Polyangiaceae bacterium]
MRRLSSVSLSLASLVLLAAACSACSPAAAPLPAKNPGDAPGVATSTAVSENKGPPADPFAIPKNLRAEVPPPATLKTPDLAQWKAAIALPGLSKAPASCTAFARTKTAAAGKSAKKGSAPVCPKEPAQLMSELGKAMSAEGARDEALFALEECAFPPGFIRSLRAELAPHECGDVIVNPMLEAPPKGLPVELSHAMVGQSLASLLRRTSDSAPIMKAPFTKERVLAFIKTELGPWVTTQAATIEKLSQASTSLDGFGLGVAAIESGNADLRLGEIIREAPVPDDFRKDPELLHIYQTQLDGYLEPRVRRGRDAALVGLRKFADVGIFQSERLSRAQGLLSKMYAGRRIDALSSVLLPQAPVAKEYLLGVLPTFYVNGSYTASLGEDAGYLGAAFQQGFPSVARSESIAGGEKLKPAAKVAHAIGRARLGLTYWRGIEFDRVIALTSSATKEEPEARFLLALSLAMRNGPSDAVEMMSASTPHALNVGKTDALDVIAAEKGPLAGMAAFDAALLRETTPPPEARPEYFQDLAKRYRTAAELLVDPAYKARAAERADHAEKIAAAAAQK